MTVRRGFCHVFGGETYRYGYLTTPESPEYLANKAAWVMAPTSLIERGNEPAPLIERGDEPAPAPSPVPAPDSGGDEDLPDNAVEDGVEDGED